MGFKIKYDLANDIKKTGYIDLTKYIPDDVVSYLPVRMKQRVKLLLSMGGYFISGKYLVREGFSPPEELGNNSEEVIKKLYILNKALKDEIKRLKGE